jgi:hypothetical protein
MRLVEFSVLALLVLTFLFADPEPGKRKRPLGRKMAGLQKWRKTNRDRILVKHSISPSSSVPYQKILPGKALKVAKINHNTGVSSFSSVLTLYVLSLLGGRFLWYVGSRALHYTLLSQDDLNRHIQAHCRVTDLALGNVAKLMKDLTIDRIRVVVQRNNNEKEMDKTRNDVKKILLLTNQSLLTASTNLLKAQHVLDQKKEYFNNPDNNAFHEIKIGELQQRLYDTRASYKQTRADMVKELDINGL